MTTVPQEALDAAAELRKRRRRHASVAAIIALALILAILLFTRTAQASEVSEADGDNGVFTTEERSNGGRTEGPLTGRAVRGW